MLGGTLACCPVCSLNRQLLLGRMGKPCGIPTPTALRSHVCSLAGPVGGEAKHDARLLLQLVPVGATGPNWFFSNPHVTNFLSPPTNNLLIFFLIYWKHHRAELSRWRILEAFDFQIQIVVCWLHGRNI